MNRIKYFYTLLIIFLTLLVFHSNSFPVYSQSSGQDYVLPANYYLLMKKVGALIEKVGDREPTEQEIEEIFNEPESILPQVDKVTDGYYISTGDNGDVIFPILPGQYLLFPQSISILDFNSLPNNLSIASGQSVIVYLPISQGNGKITQKDNNKDNNVSYLKTSPGNETFTLILYNDKNKNGKRETFEEDLHLAGVSLFVSKDDLTAEKESSTNPIIGNIKNNYLFYLFGILFVILIITVSFFLIKRKRRKIESGNQNNPLI